MTTCRFKLRAGLAACVFVLAGCSDQAPLAFLAPVGAAPPASAKALSEAKLSAGAVTLRGPEGWCIEPRSLRNSARDSFALLAGCHELTGGRVGQPMPRGYISVSIGAAQISPAAADALLADITSAESPTSSSLQDGIALAQLPHDGSEDAAPVWRAVSALGQRPSLVTVYALEDSLLSGDTGRRLATEISESLRSSFVVEEVVANVAQAPSDAEATEASAEPTTTNAGLDVTGFLGRLLNRNASE
ncbi:hypothetical protein [Primorskyibacter sp. S187A]|uniref:hypothetical protein n=1 Tax=Primorskyibacter sp. S187A TaxID=3415130 RepID=UPI003C79D4C9